MPRITAEVPDQALSWIHDWLGSLGLEPPAPLTLSIEMGDPGPLRDARPAFVQPEIEIRSAGATHEVVLDWKPAPARARLRRGALTAECVISPAAAKDAEALAWSFLTAVVVFLLRRVGWHHVHGAIALDPLARGWLLAGDSRSGKSTTAALLAARGWAVGSDDLAFLARAGAGAGADVVAARLPIRLRDGGLALLQRAAPEQQRGKSAFTPEALGGRWLARARPAIIALPRVRGTTSAARQCPPREALAALIRWSAWVALEPDYADEHLALLTALVAQSRCYELDLATDLFDREDALMGLLP